MIRILEIQQEIFQEISVPLVAVSKFPEWKASSVYGGKANVRWRVSINELQ